MSALCEVGSEARRAVRSDCATGPDIVIDCDERPHRSPVHCREVEWEGAVA